MKSTENQTISSFSRLTGGGGGREKKRSMSSSRGEKEGKEE
jgi:hypothetical protein